MKEIKDDLRSDLVNDAIEKLALYCLKRDKLFLNTDFNKTVTDNNGNTHKVYLHFQIEPMSDSNE